MSDQPATPTTDPVFHFRRISSDKEGYYYDRWDRAVAVEVAAVDQPAAIERALELSGAPPKGRFWKLHLDRIVATQ